jgi:type II secretory pathway pseudopilin PulG
LDFFKFNYQMFFVGRCVGFALVESLAALMIISVALLALGATAIMTTSASLLFSQNERSYQVARRALDLAEVQLDGIALQSGVAPILAQIRSRVEAEENGYAVGLSSSGDSAGRTVTVRAVRSNGVKEGGGVTLTRYFSTYLSSHEVSRDSR